MYLNKINLALLKTKYLNKLSFSVGGAFGFSPLDLFKNGEQGVWYDPSDLSTLFQDASGTTPVTTDGDPVGLVLDKSGNANHATQSVSASRPTYRTDGTLHWLEFDGVGDNLAGTVPINIPQPTAISLSGYMEDYSGRQIFYDSSIPRMFLSREGSGSITLYQDSFLTAQPVGDVPVVVRGVFNSSNSEIIVNGSSVAGNAGKAYTSAGGVFRLGSRSSSPNEFLDGKIYGLVVQYNETGENTWSELESYLASKAGITL